jgi:hypothetical protein
MVATRRYTQQENKVVKASKNLKKTFEEEKEEEDNHNDLMIGLNQTYTEFEVERIHNNAMISKAMTRARRNWKSFMYRMNKKFNLKKGLYKKTLLDGKWTDGQFRSKRFEELLETGNLSLIRWYQFFRGWDKFHAVKIAKQKSCHKEFHPAVDYWVEFEDFHMRSILPTHAMLFRKCLSDHWDKIPKRFQCLFVDNFSFHQKYGIKACMDRATQRQLQRVNQCYN